MDKKVRYLCLPSFRRFVKLLWSTKLFRVVVDKGLLLLLLLLFLFLLLSLAKNTVTYTATVSAHHQYSITTSTN